MEEVIDPVIAAELKAPRAGAIAGILFSILLITSLVLIRLSVPDSPRDPGTWLSHSAQSIRVALNLLPFAGIAFLWFMGVLRDRMGAKEDRFLATVSLGSGLLFLAITFASSSATGAIMTTYAVAPGEVMRLRDLHVRPHADLRVSQRLRTTDGGSVHVLDLHDRPPHRAFSALDGVSRICGGDFSAFEHWTFWVGSAGFSHVDFVD